jgi:cyclohexyl-isocyanide hydratase
MMSVNVEPLAGPEPLQIGMLLYPGLTLLDLIGPQTTLGMHGQTHLISKSLEPIASDSGIAIVPTTTYDECPRELDVLFVPGGMGTADVMEDVDTLRFLKARASTAGYVTSVCSGSLILAAAGLLQGYRATTHWSSLASGSTSP